VENENWYLSMVERQTLALEQLSENQKKHNDYSATLVALRETEHAYWLRQVAEAVNAPAIHPADQALLSKIDEMIQLLKDKQIVS
jgi:hypothetical protein